MNTPAAAAAIAVFVVVAVLFGHPGPIPAADQLVPAASVPAAGGK